MDEDEEAKARAAILARRKFFIASAMAGVAASGCGDQTAPQACLKIAPEQPIEPSPTAPAPDPSNPGPPVHPTAEPTATVTIDDDEGVPRPCLSIVAPPAASTAVPPPPPAPTTRPRVCLRMVRPDDDDGSPI